MPFVWYVGTSSYREITTQDWDEVGIIGPTYQWGADNGYAVDQSWFTPEQLGYLTVDPEFQVDKTGPRPDVPAPEDSVTRPYKLDPAIYKILSDTQAALANIDASKTSAAASATASAASATAASNSATKAKTSETNAKTSETNAKTSETNAKISEDNAFNSSALAVLAASQAGRIFGTGSPEGVKDAPIGTIYVDTETGAFYAKQTIEGNKSGWYAFISAP